MKKSLAQLLFAEYKTQEQPLEWFEVLYAQAVEEDNLDLIPWADMSPNPNLMVWANKKERTFFENRKTLVVGCGLGDDAEYLQTLGAKTTAFDLSDSAIQLCKKRFPDSAVHYFSADLLEWETEQKFDLIIEIYTLQAIPRDLSKIAMGKLNSLLQENGHLLIICRGREIDDPLVDIPFPLSKADLSPFSTKLKELSFEDFIDREDQPKRRFRVEYINTKQSS